MKALSLWQPWATLMAHQFKRNETRDWGTTYRGPLAIHAARAMNHEAYAACYMEPYKHILASIGITDPVQCPRGGIVAVCTLVDVFPVEEFDRVAKLWRQDTPHERYFGNYGSGRKVWVTQRMVRLPTPVPCVGRQGLWQLQPPIAAAVLRELVKLPSHKTDGIMTAMAADDRG